MGKYIYMCVCMNECMCVRVCVSYERSQDKRPSHLFHCHRVFNTDQINMTFGMSGQAHVINPDIRALSTAVCVSVCVSSPVNQGEQHTFTRIYILYMGF